MVDLVGSRVELRRAGVNRFEGLCPFHDERTPSFGINPAEKLYYCFGCGEGGDAFKFVQETEGVGFAGALEYLGDRYGVALELVEEDPAAAAASRTSASGCSSCSSARPPSTCATCGTPRRRRTPASTSPGAGSTRARCASSASATRRARGTRCSSPRAAPASPTASCGGRPRVALAEGGPHLRPLPPADHVPALRPAWARARVRRARDGRRPEAQVPELVRRPWSSTRAVISSAPTSPGRRRRRRPR